LLSDGEGFLVKFRIVNEIPEDRMVFGHFLRSGSDGSPHIAHIEIFRYMFFLIPLPD
jgi:hypothetical protein